MFRKHTSDVNYYLREKKPGFKKSNVGQSKINSLFKKNKYIIMAIMIILCYTSRRK